MSSLPIPFQGPSSLVPAEEGQEAFAVPCPGPAQSPETVLVTATSGTARRATCVPPEVAEALLRPRLRPGREAGVASSLTGVAGVGGLLQPPLLPSTRAVTTGILVGHSQIGVENPTFCNTQCMCSTRTA